MTLQEAVKAATEERRRLGHKKLKGSEWWDADHIVNMAFPFFIATSNEWELEPRKLSHLDERSLRARILPILKKHTVHGGIDSLMDGISNAIFTEESA